MLSNNLSFLKDVLPSAQGFSLRESEFRDFELRLRLNSDSAGISRIDFEDGLVIYAALFTFAHGRSGLKVYDLGSAMGYSTLWLAKALEDACSGPCELTAVEVRPERVEAARAAYRDVAFERVSVNFVQGDALKVLEDSEDDRVDVAFVDVQVSLYPRVVELLTRKLSPGGLAMFHNAIRPPPPAETFQLLVKAGWRYAIVPTLEGVLITRRPPS
jgi:Predicted O-methyltransferase